MPVRYYFIILLGFLYTNAHSLAGPVVKLCINDNCKPAYSIKITDKTWSSVVDLFNSPFTSDKDEQDNINNAVALIESDVYQSLANKNINQDKTTADELFSDISTGNDLKNIKTMLGVLLDNYLIKRHYLRNTVSITNKWTRLKSDALLLQSLTDSQLYLLYASGDDLGTPPVITPYKKD